MLPIAVLSCFNVQYGATGWGLAFSVNAVTVAAMGVIWLPNLVSLLAVAGGSAKTPAGEFASGGLVAALKALPPEAQREAIPAVVAALDTVEGRLITSGNPSVSYERDSLEQSLGALPVEPGEARVELTELAKEYERLRASMSPGRDRTYQMTLLLTRARALGRQAQLDAAQIDRLLDGSEGERLVGIGVAQGRPAQMDIRRMLDVVTNSRSAFEQYAALEALRRAVPQAPTELCRLVATTLTAELNRPGTHLARGSDRYQLARSILRDLHD
jgi:hypothetical protein